MSSKRIIVLLVSLSILVFASASGASYIKQKNIEDTITCQPQNSSSANLWTCKDYYGTEYKNLIILEKPQ